MKKFLFVVSFTLISNHLFSTAFKEEFHEVIIETVTGPIFERNSELKTTANLNFLKQIAKQYSEISENQKINAQNMYDYFSSSSGEAFGLDSQQASHVIKSFVDIVEGWKYNFKALLRRVFVECAASDELKEIAEPLNNDVRILFETRPFEKIVEFLTEEEATAFSKVLINSLGIEVQSDDLPRDPIEENQPLVNQSGLSRNQLALGIGTLGLGLAGVVGIGMLRGGGVEVAPAVVESIIEAVPSEMPTTVVTTVINVASNGEGVRTILWNSVCGAASGTFAGFMVGGPAGAFVGFTGGAISGAMNGVVETVATGRKP